MYQQQLAEMQSRCRFAVMIAATQGVRRQGKHASRTCFSRDSWPSGTWILRAVAQDLNSASKGLLRMMEAADKRAEERNRSSSKLPRTDTATARVSDAMTRVNGSRRQLAEYFPSFGDNDSERRVLPGSPGIPRALSHRSTSRKNRNWLSRSQSSCIER